MKEFERELKEEAQRQKAVRSQPLISYQDYFLSLYQEKKKQLEENRKRKEENAKKAEITQKVVTLKYIVPTKIVIQGM